MTLSAVTVQYVSYKQSMGMRFHTEARTLRSFCRAMGDITVAEVAADRVQAYIAGTGPVTRFWHRKNEVLRGFYRWAMARGYAVGSPLPKIVPKPPHFVPHIYSQDELQQLLDATAGCRSSRCRLQPYTCRMLILLLYAKANSTRRGWYPSAWLSTAPWERMWRNEPRITPLRRTRRFS
jgi:site-specific recombinase XerD